MTVKPLTALNNALNNRVIVELKGRREFRGTLDGYDIHMNLVLKNAEESKEGELIREMETTIVRGDNVVYISP
mgnify:FL=1